MGDLNIFLTLLGHSLIRRKGGFAVHLGMDDFVFVGIAVAFFALGIAYAHFCERLR